MTPTTASVQLAEATADDAAQLERGRGVPQGVLIPRLNPRCRATDLCPLVTGHAAGVMPGERRVTVADAASFEAGMHGEVRPDNREERGFAPLGT